MPIATGFCDYFPLAIAAVAELSKKGNDQHNPGTPLHWDRTKSQDEADALMRHFLERGTLDTDGIRHSCKMAWRAMALLQKELEAEQINLAIASTYHKPMDVDWEGVKTAAQAQAAVGLGSNKPKRIYHCTICNTKSETIDCKHFGKVA